MDIQVTNTKPNFIRSFPYPTIRPQQQKILNELSDNWNDYRVFVVDASTGSGKSGLAAAIGGEFKTYLLTESKSLQDQYMREFSDRVVSLKGKSNYTCAKNDNFTVESSPCQMNNLFVKRCRETTVCTYYSAREKAKLSKVFLTNYNYFMLLAKNGRDGVKRPVVVCDEGHVVSEKLADFAKVLISLNYLERTYEMDELESLSFPDTDDGEDIAKVLVTVSRALSIRRNNLYTNLCDFLNIVVELEEDMTPEEAAEAFEHAIGRAKLKLEAIGKQATDIMKVIRNIDNQTHKIDLFLQNQSDTWVFDVEDNGRKITITPIDARRVFKTNILENADKVILMSASIGSVDSLAEELGLDKKEICYITCDSPFDPEKGPIHILGDFDFSFKGMDVSLPGALKLIDDILDIYSEDKGIIHAGNYKITSYILKNSRHKRRLIGKGTDEFVSNETLFDQHASSPEPSVLISPSMHTGIDLKGDLSKFQIIVKFPFSSLTDKRTKMKMEQNSHWYANETWKKIIQASGRSIRTDTDEAQTFILDRAFHFQYKLFRKHLPMWFKKRIVFANDE